MLSDRLPNVRPRLGNVDYSQAVQAVLAVAQLTEFRVLKWVGCMLNDEKEIQGVGLGKYTTTTLGKPDFPYKYVEGS